MTDQVLIRITPESLKDLKDGVKSTFENDKKNYDQRDIDRFNQEDWYQKAFVHWKEKVPDAVELVKTTFKWRKETKIRELTIEDIGEDFFKKGLFYTNGFDRDGKRIMYMNSSLHYKKFQEEHKKMLWFWLENLQNSEPGKKITFIMDIPGTGMSNVDMDFIKLIVATFANYYPGMLSRLIVFDMPWLFNKVWAVVKKFLTQEQRDVTILCSKSEINQYIDEDNLPARMGGKNEYEFSFKPFDGTFN